MKKLLIQKNYSIAFIVLGFCFLLFCNLLAEEPPGLIWQKIYDTGRWDYAYGIAVDRAPGGPGSIYVTGESDNGANYDYLTIKYNSNGDTVWQKKYDNGSNEYSRAITVDAEGYVYVTGFCTSTYSSTLDCLTIKYNPSGDIVWQKVYDSGVDEQANAIAVDGNGNIYITGRAGQDCLVIKYTSNGDIVWERKYDGGRIEIGRSIAVDSYGNVYITGSSIEGTKGDYLTIKYNSNGDTVWQRIYNGGDDDCATALAVNELDNIYVTGYSWNGPALNCVTIKYNSNGDTTWQRVYGGAGWSQGFGMAIDSSNNIFVVGEVYNEGKDTYFVVKYTVSGNVIWERTSDQNIDWSKGVAYGGRSIALDVDNNFYITGRSAGKTSCDYFIIKYGRIAK